jgi:hypothetical protein
VKNFQGIKIKKRSFNLGNRKRTSEELKLLNTSSLVDVSTSSSIKIIYTLAEKEKIDKALGSFQEFIFFLPCQPSTNIYLR